jgi:hypothetical protein
MKWGKEKTGRARQFTEEGPPEPTGVLSSSLPVIAPVNRTKPWGFDFSP